MSSSSSSHGLGKRRFLDAEESLESAHESAVPNTEGSSSKPKRQGRGPNRGVVLEARRNRSDGDNRIPIVIYERDGKPICDDSSKLANQIGILFRTIVPLDVEQWADVKDIHRTEVLNRLVEQFTLDLNDVTTCRYLKVAMSSRHKNFRYRLHKFYRELPPEESRNRRHPDVETDEGWHRLCDRWESEKFKKVSETNSKARASVPYPHTAGTMSFLKHKEKAKKKEGRDVDDIELFEMTHRRKDKEWVHPEACSRHERMLEIKNTPVAEGTQPPTAEEVAVQVLGPLGARGWGPPTTSAARRRADRSQAAIEEMARLSEESQVQRQLLESQQQLLESQGVEIVQLRELLMQLTNNLGAGSSQRGGSSTEDNSRASQD